jgi:Plasmid replication region DNA-binding N-term
LEKSAVNDAVRTLRARGERVSVRSVHTLLGHGSFRDISRLLKDSMEFLTDDEAGALEDEPVEPVPPPSLGKIVEAFMGSQKADREAGEFSADLDQKREQLRDLVARRPPPALVPEDVAESVDARFEHDATVAHLQAEIAQLQRIVAERQAVGRTWRIERNKLQQRAQELTRAIIPDVRRRLIAAREALALLERDTAHQLMLARRQVENRQRALAAYQQELQDLTGDQER